ncbi:hypothetical protein DPX16_20079 [Anabarilius grahami]|uniref:Uncharacterized protein n=1 Tax=Anabarilius grahami TaxID=495550 RepID=A0A3N0XQQ6_ANAGA|nr:hypothetical protein DPX16_20079 [Anabarilius grahami]
MRSTESAFSKIMLICLARALFAIIASTKTEQDQAISQLITVQKVQRRRPKFDNSDMQKNREVTNECHLLTEDHPAKIPVCKATFCSVLGISKDRVSRVAKYYALNATARPEHRGGARKVAENEAKKQLVMDHIQTFTCRASHYGRRGAPGRKYLPSDLSHFNLEFGHPATDACSSCARFQLRVKDPSLTEEEKHSESASYILHRRRAWAFYDLLGKVDQDAVTLCFDFGRT